MITIKKGSKVFKFENDEFTVCQDTPDGMYFKFTDGSELMINGDVRPERRAVPNMLMRSTADNILVDFNSKDKFISFGNN
jgi:hypothetical protein